MGQLVKRKTREVLHVLYSEEPDKLKVSKSLPDKVDAENGPNRVEKVEGWKKSSNQRKKRNCWYFLHSKCKFGVHCKNNHDEALGRRNYDKNIIHSTETDMDDKESQYSDTVKSSLLVKTSEIENARKEETITAKGNQKAKYSDAVKSSLLAEESEVDKESSKEGTKNVEIPDAERDEGVEYPKLQSCNSKNEAVEIRIPCYIGDKFVEKRIEVKPNQCNICEKNTNLICSQCRCMFYCNKDHQRKDWKIHGALCRMLARKNPREAKSELF